MMVGSERKDRLDQGSEDDSAQGPREGETLEDWVARESKEAMMKDWDPRDLGC